MIIIKNHVLFYENAGIKNPWVHGFGYYIPRPMPTNRFGFLPMNKPTGREVEPYPCPNRVKPVGFQVSVAIFTWVWSLGRRNVFSQKLDIFTCEDGGWSMLKKEVFYLYEKNISLTKCSLNISKLWLFLERFIVRSTMGFFLICIFGL